MASEDPGLKQLDIKLYRDDDDGEDRFYKRKLEVLVNGDVTPSEAAADFDTWVVQEANSRLEALLKRPDPRNLTPEEEAQGLVSMRAIAPNPTGAIELLFPSIARLCSAFPPYHAGQDRIIQFLGALKAMPEHEVYDGVPPEDPNEEYNKVTLWPFGGNWMALAEIFSRECDAYSYPFGPAGDEGQLRWRNWQSAIARITALGLIDCSFMCALGELLPSSPDYPDLEKNKVGGPNRIGGNVIAGAQWLLWPDIGRFVYQECKKVERVEGPRAMWSLERWRQWKNQFAFVQGDERFGEQARLVAKLTGHQMLAYEEEDKPGTK